MKNIRNIIHNLTFVSFIYSAPLGTAGTIDLDICPDATIADNIARVPDTIPGGVGGDAWHVCILWVECATIKNSNDFDSVLKNMLRKMNFKVRTFMDLPSVQVHAMSHHFLT